MQIIEFIRSVILGVVEGITEWLPISSTGHMILVNELIKNEGSFTASDLYLYVIQLGAILAVVTLYFNKLNPFSKRKTAEEKKATYSMWLKVIVACIPAAVIGLLFDDYMDKIENWQVVSAMLIVYGIGFLLVERLNKKTSVLDMSEMSYKTAILIGLFQVLSIIPGTSRSGATILGAMILGCSRAVAAEFSFFLAVPVMLGVTVLKFGKYIFENGLMMPLQDALVLVVGMAVAYVVSMLSIKYLVSYVKNHDFKPFGRYRIVVGLVVIAYFVLTTVI